MPPRFVPAQRAASVALGGPAHVPSSGLPNYGSRGLSLRPRLKPVLKVLALIFGLALIAILTAGGWAGWLYAHNNFHTVIPGTLYRSAQPNAAELRHDIQTYGIKSVLNLRGANPGKDWYQTEIGIVQEAGITHADFKMSAHRVLPEDRVQDLVKLMESLPKPILIHCLQGADRSGLASALYLAHFDNASEARAEQQLSFRYGHVSIPWLSAAWPMNITWENQEPSLDFARS